MPVLNYKYEIFPTKPQKQKIRNILFHCSLQWNKATAIQQSLQKAINLGQIEYFLRTFKDIKSKKEMKRGGREANAKKVQMNDPSLSGLSLVDVAVFSDLKRLFNRHLPDIKPRYLDPKVLAKELSKIYKDQAASFNAEIKENILKEKKDKKLFDKKNKKRIKQGKPVEEYKKKKYSIKTKKTLYWDLIKTSKEIAGEVGKQYITQSFSTPKNSSLSETRAMICGSAKSKRWDSATKPSREQQKYGAKGIPTFKKARNWSSFDYPDKRAITTLIRPRKKGKGHLLKLKVLPIGMQEVKLKYHRDIPPDGKIKQFNIKRDSKHFFATLSVEIPEKDWVLPNPEDGVLAGIDPGADTPLTIGINDLNRNKLSGMSVKYSFIDAAQVKLEKLQQKLANKQGRKRTKNELQKALNDYKESKEYKKLIPDQQKEKFLKKNQHLQRENVYSNNGEIRKPSKRWFQLNSQIKELQYSIKNQRKDLLEKVSHTLVTNCELISFGHWEPGREVLYRKKVKELNKQVRLNNPGAKKELKELEKSLSKNAAKGSKKRRRGGRDRSIATLRSKIESKAERSGAVFVRQNESKTTMTCCVCREETGPKKDLETRQWVCTRCGTRHGRDLNSSFEILNKCFDTLAAQANAPAIPEDAKSDTRDPNLSTMSSKLNNYLARIPVTDSGNREVSPYLLNKKPNNFSPKLWRKNKSSMKSLENMGVIHTPKGIIFTSEPLESFNPV